MKKLFLGIVVLGLMLSENSFGSILINNCQTIKEEGTVYTFCE